MSLILRPYPQPSVALYGLALIIMSTLSSTRGSAQSTIPPSESAESDEVIVREQRGSPRIERAHLDSHRAQLEEVVSSLGAWSTNSGGQGARMEIQLRGSGGHQSGLYIDDIPLHSLRGQAVDLSLFPLELFSSVELIRGADGARSGSGALGGSVKLQSARPQDGLQRRLTMGVSTARWAQMNSSIGWGGQLGGGSVGISLGGGPNSFAYLDASGRARRRASADFGRVAAVTRGALKVKRHTVNISGGVSQLNRSEPGPEGFTLAGRESEQRALWIGLSDQLRHTWASSELITRITLNALHLSYIFSEVEPLWQSNSSGEYVFEDQRIGLEGDVKWSHQRAQLALNAQLSDTRALTAEETRGRVNAAVAPRVTLKLSERWRVEGATRLDLNSERTPQVVSSAKLTHVSARSGWRAWLGWSEVWRDPGFDERWLQGPGIVANPDLDPEMGQWAELGGSMRARWRRDSLRGDVKFSLKGFTQVYDRLITYIPLDPYRYRAENLEGADIHGLESSLSLSLRAHRYHARLRGQLSVLRHQTRHEPRAPLPLRPQRFGTSELSLTRALDRGHIRGELGVIARGAVTSDRFGERELTPRSVWRLSVGRVWRSSSGRWSSLVTCDNLFNQAGYDFALTPRVGRSVWLSLGWSD